MLKMSRIYNGGSDEMEQLKSYGLLKIKSVILQLFDS